TVTVVITGAEDSAVISGRDTGAVTEDASSPTLSDSGTLAISDADGGQAAFTGTADVVAAPGTLGSLDIAANGTWTYSVANSAVQYLVAGQSKSEVFTVRSVDGTEHTVEVTIHGTADAVTVSSPEVNEASPWAVFTVRGNAGEPLRLQLADGSATGAGTDFASSGAGLEISLDGGRTWSAYAGGATLPADGVLLARTPIVNDGVSEGAESFTLTATPVGGLAAVGTATVRDDGTGTVFRNDGSADAQALLDDDRAVSVSSVRINEASPYAVFTLSGGAAQQVQLALAAGTADAADYGGTETAHPQLEVFDGNQWVQYQAGSWTRLDAQGRLLVRTAITNDALDEGDHDFALRVQTTGGGRYSGTGVIDDHGGGSLFLVGNHSGLADTPGTAGAPRLDDDRPVPVPVPVPAPAPAPAPEPAPAPAVVAPAPVPATVQRFDSALASPVLATATDPIVLAPVQSSVADTRDVGDIYTRSSGFRTMVTPANEPTLRTFRGLEDQVVPAVSQINLQVPADAFVHTDANETVTLVATLADGRPLPTWLQFDGKAGTFTGQPPAGKALDLRIKVQGRDSQGREANAMFRIKSAPGTTPGAAPEGLPEAEQGANAPATGVGSRGGLDAQLMRGDALGQRQGLWQSQRNGQKIAQRPTVRRGA
ncbi:VCBS domain-containing protein, partial [Azohydromonas lata]